MKTPGSLPSVSLFAQLFLAALLLCSLCILHPVYAQHALAIDRGDTVHLDIDAFRGALQWQLSTDEVTWSDLPGRTRDTIKYVPDEFPAYLRLQITEGECDPHYSEIVTITALPPSVPTVTTLSPVNIGTITAQSGGEVVRTGGSPIVAQGIVYSTVPGPDLSTASSTSAATGKRDFVSTLSGLTPNTTYYIRAYAVNSLGLAYGEEIQFTTLAYVIGGEGPAGGIIFYDKGSYSDGWRYLEAAPAGWAGTNDPWVDLSWGCEGVTVGETSTAVGTGKENTARILSAGCAGSGTAVQIAANATTGGYTDWFLPSRDELYYLYNNLYNLGANFHNTFGFQTKTYTSSSELDATGAWGYDFAAGGNIQHIKTKIASISVRAVRRF